MPKVSVLTPIYNTNPEHLRECIESILNQTFTDFEFLILNDSPNNTELDTIVASYKDKRIKYIKNEHNMGISASRNKLLEMSRGEYLAIFDHDDISLPQRLEKEVAYLDANPDIGVVSAWMEFFGKANFIMQNPEFDTQIKINLTNECSIAHTACMIRKSVLNENNIKYESFYTPCEDYRLWARLMDITHFHNLQMVLVKYRWLENNTTHTMQNRMQRSHQAVNIQICNKYPMYRHEYELQVQKKPYWRLRLFGIIPLLKLKHNWIKLFEIIPMIKIKGNK